MTRKIELTEFQDAEIYPIEKSAEGTNGYYLEYCLYGCRRPNYAACLNKLASSRDDVTFANDGDCLAAIGRKECLAMRMRQEEVSEGRAIYYINRKKAREYQEENARLMGVRFGQKLKRELNTQMPNRSASKEKITQNIPQGIPHKPEPKIDKNHGSSYADAINKRMRELNKGGIDSLSDEEKIVNSKNKVTGDLLKHQSQKGLNPKTNTSGMSLLEMARLAKQQESI